jgi:hypothetical protein
LTPSSTVPSTRLVIIWLKRCLARSLTESALELDPIGVGVAVGDGLGLGDALGVGVGVGDGLGDGVGEGEYSGVGEGEGGVGLCADAGMVSAGVSSREIAAASATDRVKLRMDFAIISVRTACRWDRCRHRQAA